MIFYYFDSLINIIKYLSNEFKNNKNIVQPIEWLTIKIMQEIIERLVSITYLWNFIKYWFLDNQ